ncbi:MAG: hypothetical protein E7Z89_01070 [Cyanobacteria bacterium SIG28]|nr:hypothetical protein [Cyanobacteria bacterium SIG28]
MTDQMQVQQQRPSAVPYVLGGAAAGAVGGWATNEFLLKKKMTHDDIIAEVNAKDKLDIRTKEGAPEAATWKDVKAKADEVKAAEQALEEAKKPVLAADDELAKKLQGVTDEYEKEISKLTAEKTRTVGGGKEEIQKFDNVWSGKPKDAPKAQAKYNKLKAAYEREVIKVDSLLNKPEGLSTRQTARETELTNYINKELRTYKRSTMEKIEDAYAQKYVGKKPTAEYQRAIDTALQAFPDVDHKNPKLKPEEWESIGRVLEKGEKPTGGRRYKTIDIALDPNYPHKRSTIEYKVSDLEDFIDTMNDSIKEKRMAYADEIFDNARAAVVGQKNVSTYAKDFTLNLTSTELRELGFSATDDFSKVVNESNADTLKIPHAKDATKFHIGYEADEMALKKAIHNRTGMPATLNGAYGTTDPEEAMKILKARKAKLGEYSEGLKKIEKQIAGYKTRSSVITDLKGQVADFKANHEGLNTARANFESEFNGVIKGGSSRTETIAGLSREEAIKKVDETELGKRFAKIKGDYANKAKNSGAVDENAVKQATSRLDEARAALKTKAGELASKMKTGGVNKYLAAGIGAVALGASALLLRPKAKETQA